MPALLRRCYFFVAVLLLTTSLCGMASGVRFLSFDASLLLGVDTYSIERLENINYALARASLTSMASHADAICLQGYWLPYQVQQLNATLSPYLPYSYSTPPVTGTCFCTDANLAPLLGCLKAQNCSAMTGNAQLLCGFGCLNAALPTMDSVCANCLTAGLGGIVSQTASLEQVIGGCMAAAALNASGQDCVPYGGYSGNLLFSRSPFRSVSAVSLALPVTPRPLHSDAILATTSFSGLGDVNLVCTQLQPSGPPVTNATVLQAFKQLNMLQLQILSGAIDQLNNTTGVKQVVVMGNFKQSPSIPSAGVQPVFEDLYSSWNASGYSEYVSQCTACAANRLLLNPFFTNTMSSHIFLRGFNANPNVESVVGKIALNTTTTILDITTSTTPHAEVVPFSANYAVQVDINVASASASEASAMSGVAGHLLRSLLEAKL